MTVLLQDACNRTDADLSASPAGRWSLPTPPSGVNAWGVDGAMAYTTAAASVDVLQYAKLTGTDPGVSFGEVRARIKRNSTAVKIIGLSARGARVNPGTDLRRWAFVLRTDVTPNRFELRLYSAYNTFQTITQVNVSAVTPAVTVDTGFHTMKIRVAKQGSITGGGPLSISMRYDDVYIGGIIGYPDTLTPLSATSYRAPGMEAQLSSTTATDTAQFDNLEWDDLTIPTGDPMPTLTAEPTLAAITISTEGTAVSSLPFVPDFGEMISESYLTQKVGVEAGYEVTWAGWQSARRLMRLVHRALTSSETSTLQTFLDAHNGPETPFTYTLAEGGTVKACFIPGTFSFRWLDGSGAVQTVEYTVMELTP